MRTEGEVSRYLEKARRLGNKIVAGVDIVAEKIDRAGERVETGLEGATLELRRLGSKAKNEAEALADRAKKEAAGLAVQAKTTLKEKIVPAATTAWDEATLAVRAHGGTTLRRVAADLREQFETPKQTRERFEAEFGLLQREIRHRLGKNKWLSGFLASEAARSNDFDTAQKSIRGIPISPESSHLATLKDDFFPVRLFLALEGLRCRTYAQTHPMTPEDSPGYVIKEERWAKANDLRELGLKAVTVLRIVDEFIKKHNRADGQTAQA